MTATSRRLVVTLLLPLAILAACRTGPEPRTAVPAVEVPPPPVTRAQDLVETIHGVEVADPYRWLEEQEAPEVREWIEAQNAYTDRVLGGLPERAELRERVARLLETDTIGFPRVRGDRYFFSKRRADQDLEVIYVREGAAGEDRVLIDPHPMSADHTVSVDLVDVSMDGSTVAYAVRRGGEDEVEGRLFDVRTGRDLPGRLPYGRYYGGADFAPDGRSLYYARHTEDGPRVFRFDLADGSETELFGQGYGPEVLILPALSPDGRWLTANVAFGSAGDRGDVYLLDLEGAGEPVPVAVDLDARFGGQVVDDVLIMQTNLDAPNGRVFAVPVGSPGREHWREILPERPRAALRGVQPAGGRLFVQYLEDVRPRVEIFDLAGQRLGELPIGELGSIWGPSGEWEQDELFYLFTSFHVPSTVYRYEVETGAESVWDRVEIPVDTSGFEVKQEFYASKDGTRVPMFLVHRRGLALDGSNPTLLTGYGGFNASQTPRFSTFATLWVELGGVYAVANLRGGGEYGEEWHRAGMLGNKQNVFDDFIAAAEWLIGEGYTRPEKLAVRGGSNGGLLVGAFVTQRPELAEAAIISYPLLDMVRYHRFLVARFWVPEYGSAEDPEQLRYLLEYSPYHNVAPGADYPAVLLLTGDADTRVAPLHARKMAALLQVATGSDEPVLLRYEVKAGHVGGQPLSEQIDDMTESLSFLAWQLGV